jgi:putative proteasome-type protease
MIYPSGSIVETSNVWTYFQIGESRFGKAIVDWAIKGRNLSLDQATRCALLSMDATLGSNLSVGMPLDLLVYERDALRVTRFASLDQHSDYYRALHDAWCDGMSMLITGLPGPLWTTPAGVPRGHHAESSTAKR